MLETVPRYDGGRVSRVGERAVVVGGSMAGLLAARVLADAFEEVVVVERDELPDEPNPRQGVPQSVQPHVLQEAGRATLEDLFPGFGEDLLSDGALMADAATEFRFYREGDFLADPPHRMPWYCASRPLFEVVTRRHVAGLDGVTFREHCQLVEYLIDLEASTVDGLIVRGEAGGEETIEAALVVDATGRTSRTPAWLDEHGYRSPPTDEVHVDVTYSTVTLSRPPADRSALLMLPEPPRTAAGPCSPSKATSGCSRCSASTATTRRPTSTGSPTSHRTSRSRSSATSWTSTNSSRKRSSATRSRPSADTATRTWVRFPTGWS